MEPQWVITQARKRAITKADMEYQLGVLAGREAYLKRELAALGLVQNFADLGDWQKHIRAFLAEVREDLVWLERTAASEEEQHE